MTGLQTRLAHRGLSGRIALATSAVAVVSVALSGLLGVGLVRGAARDVAQRQLGREATIAASLLADPARGAARAGLPAALVTLLNRQQITLLVVLPDGAAVAPARPRRSVDLDVADARAVAAGQSVDAQRRAGGRAVLVAGRASAAGGGVLLVQPVSAAGQIGGALGRRGALALCAGLVVALGVGLALARRLARPLGAAAAAAHRLAGGERDVWVRPDGPAELAAVADALNTLSAGLAASEGRQREFLLSISHELRTPLTAIRGYAEALADGVATEPVATGGVLVAEAARLERLVTDLLDLARLGAEDFRIDVVEVDLTGLLAAAAQVWRGRCAAEGVALRTELPAAPLWVRTDPTRVRQILDGLAENALRVVPSGAPIVFGLQEEAGGAVLAVRDGGPGLTPQDCAVAFDRSVLYDRYRGIRRVGTGVGLALVAGLTRRLGGTASAGRAPEGGAAFTIRLPSQVSAPPRPGGHALAGGL